MKIKVNLQQRMQEIRRRVGLSQQEIQKQVPVLLQLLGVQVLSWARLDYEAKGRGGVGSDGIRWRPLAASTLKKKQRRGRVKPKQAKSGKVLPGRGPTQIGVDTGLQRASASPGFIGPDGKGGNLFTQDIKGVTVGFNRTYSKYFDEARPLLPGVMPRAWQQGLEDVAQRWADEIIGGKL